MSSDPEPVPEAGRRDPSVVRAAGKGPLLLAKLIISYLDKKNQVFVICFDPLTAVHYCLNRAPQRTMSSWWKS